jgi:hypothetical protein
MWHFCDLPALVVRVTVAPGINALVRVDDRPMHGAARSGCGLLGEGGKWQRGGKEQQENCQTRSKRHSHS